MCDGRKLAKGFGRVVAMAAALLTLLFGGCVRNEFDVEVNLPEKVSGHYSFLYYASDPAKGWFAEEMMMVEKGKGAVTGRTRNPSLVWIMDASGRPAALFYAERGDRIRITGDSENPASWRVKGNDVTGRIDGWRHSNRAALSSMDARKVNAAVSGYVRENPSDPVSAILMAVYYDRRADEAGFAATWKMLRDDALEKEWVDLVSRSDISTGGPWMRKMPREVVLKSVGNGVDTLRFGSKPALLYFSRVDSEGRREAVAELRRLCRKFPDSVSRIIAEVSLETDSMTRIWHVRTDSLQGAVKGWMPLGPADDAAICLGVEQVPLFIVAGKNGKEIYRGENPAEASKAFEKEME